MPARPLITQPLRKLFPTNTNIQPEDTFNGKIIIVDLPVQEFRLVGRIAQGEEVINTRHEKPVVRLVPEGRRNLESVRAAVAGLFELRQQIFHRNQGKPKTHRCGSQSLDWRGSAVSASFIVDGQAAELPTDDVAILVTADKLRALGGPNPTTSNSSAPSN